MADVLRNTIGPIGGIVAAASLGLFAMLGFYPRESFVPYVETERNIAVEEGTRAVELSCETNGLPELVHWTHSRKGGPLVTWVNGSIRSPPDDPRYEPGPGLYALTVRDVRRTDGGRYVCSVSHNGNITTNHTDISVSDGIVKTEAQKNADEAGDVMMVCSFHGNPSEVTWKRDYTLTSSEVITWRKGGSKSGECFNDGSCDITDDFTLKISPVIKADEGMYTCGVSYYAGHYISASTHFTVKGGTISTGPAQTVKERSGVDIPCKFSGKPFRVQWRKDDSLLLTWENGEKTGYCYNKKSCHLNRDYSLSISAVAVADGGRYSCSITYKQAHQQPLQNYTELLVIAEVTRTDPPSPPQPRPAPTWLKYSCYILSVTFLVSAGYSVIYWCLYLKGDDDGRYTQPAGE